MASLTNLAKTSLTFVAFNIPRELAHCSRCQSTSSPLSIITLVNPGTQDSMHYSIICLSAMITWLITRTMHKDMGVAQNNIHSRNKKVILNDWLVPKKCFSELWNGGHVQLNTLTNRCWSTSLETQGQLVGAGKSLNGREKKFGRRKVENTKKNCQHKVKWMLSLSVLFWKPSPPLGLGQKHADSPIKPVLWYINCIMIHQTHYEKSDWLRAFNQFTIIACELDMINAICAADIAFIMSSSTSTWLLNFLECSPQKQNGWTLRFCFWGWIMWKMYNKTIIEFGFRMIEM